MAILPKLPRGRTNMYGWLKTTNPGYVYFIIDERSQAIKIGWARNPEMRLQSLQVANPNELRLLGSITGGCGLEGKIHNQFDHLRIRGEWFRLDFDLLGYLIDLGFLPSAVPAQG